MRYKTIQEVPVAIREFYVEDVRQEESGNTIPKITSSFDEDGKVITTTVQIPEIVPVTYVVEIPSPRLESLYRLQLIVHKHSLKEEKRSFIDESTLAYLNSLQWDWLAKYKNWEDLKPLEDDERFLVYENISDSLIYSQDLFNDAYKEWLDSVPLRPKQVTAEEYQLVNYEFFRRYLPASKQNEMWYDDTRNGTNTWTEHNDKVKANWPKKDIK